MSGRTTRPRRGGIPESPRAPAPRSSLSSTVSAWSVRVWPVAIRAAPTRAASARSAAYRARRAAAWRLPAPTTTFTTERGTPSRAQLRRAVAASASTPPRRPWSTKRAWTGPTSPASRRDAIAASSAVESGPAESATSTGSPRAISPRRRTVSRTDAG